MQWPRNVVHTIALQIYDIKSEVQLCRGGGGLPTGLHLALTFDYVRLGALLLCQLQAYLLLVENYLGEAKNVWGDKRNWGKICWEAKILGEQKLLWGKND